MVIKCQWSAKKVSKHLSTSIFLCTDSQGINQCHLQKIDKRIIDLNAALHMYAENFHGLGQCVLFFWTFGRNPIRMVTSIQKNCVFRFPGTTKTYFRQVHILMDNQRSSLKSLIYHVYFIKAETANKLLNKKRTILNTSYEESSLNYTAKRFTARKFPSLTATA